MDETQGDGEPRSSYPFQGEVIAELVLGRSEERTERGLTPSEGVLAGSNNELAGENEPISRKG